MSSSVSALAKSIVIILMIMPSTWIDASKMKRRGKPGSWQSALAVPLPEPIDSGVQISSINNYDDYKDDDDEDNDGDQTTFHYNHIGHPINKPPRPPLSSPPVAQKLNAGHRCSLNETTTDEEEGPEGPNLHCKDGLQCRIIPPDTETSYGKCIQVDCSPDCRHNHTLNGGLALQCPDDSDLELRSIEMNGQICCFRYCKCNQCVENREKCKRGYIKLEESNGMPGRCCDRIKCSHVTLRNCTGHENQTFDSGESWHRSDDCHRCKCIDGVWKCEAIENCPEECLPQNSSSIHLKPDQCCLPCKGCIYEGKKYEHQQKWLDNDCRRCECRNEKYVCDIEFGGPKFCDRPCTKHEKREWHKDQCCDKCQCQLTNCLFGFKINQTDGTKLCQCQEEDDEQQQPQSSIDSTTTSAAANNNNSSSVDQLNNCEKQDLNDILRVVVIVSAVIIFGTICTIILSFYCHYPSGHHRRRNAYNKRLQLKQSANTANNSTTMFNNDRTTSSTVITSYGGASYPEDDDDPIESKLMLDKPYVGAKIEEMDHEEEEETKMMDR